MTAAVIQALLAVVAGAVLFMLWRLAAPRDPRLRLIVAAGFLARAIGGQLLFWISWAELPFARSLQYGRGLWFFALDAMLYVPPALAAVRRGVWAMLTVPPSVPSSMYVKVLAVAMALLGEAMSVALVVNLFSFLALVAIVVRWDAAPRVKAVAIAVASLTPSFILWSFQPLKDAFFQLLFVAFIAACALWLRACTARAYAVAGALLTALLYAISAIRWYAGFAMLVVVLLLLVVTVVRAERRGAALIASLLLLLALRTAVVAGSGPRLATSMATLLVARNPAAPQLSLADDAMIVRERFERSQGSTAIAPGTALQAPAAPRSNAGITPAEIVEIRRSIDASAAQWSRGAERSGAGALRVTGVRIAPIGPGSVDADVRWEMRGADGAMRRGTFVTTLRRRPDGGWQALKVASEHKAAAPKTHLARLLSGTAVMLLPQAIGQRLGLFEVGGGRGLLWFTDLDTILFDALLLFTIVCIAKNFRTARREPLFWCALLITLFIGGPIAYSIANWGTLFRLRGMIYMGLVCTTLTAARPRLLTAPVDRA
ncbi:MAG TPA: hypothetical protein VF824_02675 [Thermoanaerobaculia bacterium]